MNHKKKLALMGCGFLGNIVVRAWVRGLLPDYELVGVASRSFESAKKTAARAGCPACHSLSDLLAHQPDFIVETASVECVKNIALPTLEAGVDLVLISIGALADDNFRKRICEVSRHTGARVHIASGAVGGFDVLQTVSLMAKAQGLSEAADIHTRKSPASLQNTSLYHPALMDAKTDVFEGTAAEAIALLPTKVNVAVASSLATTGPSVCGTRITSVPGFVGDDHKITAETNGVRAVVDVYSSTADIAGWSIVSLLRNLASPICLY